MFGDDLISVTWRSGEHVEHDPVNSVGQSPQLVVRAALDHVDPDQRQCSAPALGAASDLLAHEDAGFPRSLLPREDAHRHDRLFAGAEAEPPEGPEELVPVDLTLADVQVLMDPRRGTGGFTM